MILAECKRILKQKSFLWTIVLFLGGTLLGNTYILNRKDVQALSKDLPILNTVELEGKEHPWQIVQNAGGSEVAVERASFIAKYKSQYEASLKEVEQKQGSFLFDTEESHILLEKNKDVYNKILSEDLTVYNDLLLKYQTQFAMIRNFLLLGIGFLLVHILIQQDKESGLLPLYGSTVTTTTKLILSKLTVILMTFGILFLGTSILDLITLKIGGLNLNAPIQQLYQISYTSFTCSIGQYSILQNSFMFLGILTTLLFFTTIYCFTDSSSISFAILAIFMAAEILAANFISIASSLHILKEINLWSALTEQTFPDSLSIFFHQAIPEAYWLPIVFLLFGIVLFILTVLFYRRAFRSKAPSVRSLPLRSRFTCLYQIRELLFSGKGIFILGAVLLYSFVSVANYTATRPKDEVAYEQFATQYYGPINDELLSRIQKDKKRIADAAARIDEVFLTDDPNFVLTEELQQELEPIQEDAANRNNIERLDAEVSSLQSIGAEYFSDNRTLELLVQKHNPSGTMILTLLAIIPLLVCVIDIMSPFYQSSMNRLVFSTVTGKKKYLWKEFLLFLAFGILLDILLNGSHFIKITNTYSFAFVNLPIRDALGVNSDIHLIPWFLLLCLNHIVVLSTFIVLAMKMSKKFGMIGGMAITILIVCALTISPIGLMTILRYDFLNHLLLYIILMAIGIDFCIINLIKE